MVYNRGFANLVFSPRTGRCSAMLTHQSRLMDPRLAHPAYDEVSVHKL